MNFESTAEGRVGVEWCRGGTMRGTSDLQTNDAGFNLGHGMAVAPCGLLG